MKLFLINQRSRFPHHLQALKQKSVMPYDRSELQEKVTHFPVETTLSLQELNTDFLFDYAIFPEHILSCYPEWIHENRSMQVGDTIVQQICLPPVSSVSIKAIFGVRICEIINEPKRIGFSYETLEGHAERGVSTFVLEQSGEKPTFAIHTFSSPGNRITRLIAAVFTVPYQAYCTRAAGKNVVKQLEALR
jgi:hypothetical protein